MPSAGINARAAVIVPVFNRRDLLECTVASLRAQTLPNAEFILVDDRSEESVWRYLQSLTAIDSRFSVIRKPDSLPKGCQTSKNLGLEACRAEAVVFLDSDDLLSPECLEKRYMVLAANHDVDLVVGYQATFKDQPGSVRWVNIAKPDMPDLDRFLDLGDPVDVPWVNGGVMIRVKSLRREGIRWRTEFHWDDVAFHFDCLVSGLRSKWMPFSGSADAYYRLHCGDRYGHILHKPDGIRNAAGMIRWMHQRLVKAGSQTEPQRRALVNSFYHACVLRSLDAEEFGFAGELINGAAEGGLLNPSEARGMRTYRIGRQCFRRWPRIRYYWNRAARRNLLREFYRIRPWTYGTVVPASAEAASGLEALWRSTSTAGCANTR